MDNLKVKLGQRIKFLRKSCNISQERLAEMINMDITSLSKIETGRNYPQPETIEKISKALNVDVSQLFLFKTLDSKEEYIDAINKNIQFISDNTEKLKVLYKVSESLL